MWLILTLLAFLAIVVVIVRKAHRDANKDLNVIHKQANCGHPYDYRMNGRRYCAACGKELPRRSEVV